MEAQEYQIKALAEVFLNDVLITKENGFKKLNNLDDIRIACSSCSTPHVWKFIVKEQPKKQMGIFDK